MSAGTAISPAMATATRTPSGGKWIRTPSVPRKTHYGSTLLSCPSVTTPVLPKGLTLPRPGHHSGRYAKRRSAVSVAVPEPFSLRIDEHRGRTVGQASRRDRSRRNRGEVRSHVPAAGCRSGRSPGNLFSRIFGKFRSSSLACSAKSSWIGLGVREIFGNDRNFDHE